MGRRHKTTDWMWYVFPQMRGLGSSENARRFAIVSFDEARVYLAHPVPGARFRECATALLATEHTTNTAEDIFGPTDRRKLRSSMTLFLRAAPSEPLFRQVLDRFFVGPDGRTDDILRHQTVAVPNPPMVP